MLGLGVTTILAESAVLAVLLVGTPGEALSSDWMGRLLGRLAFSQHPLWPSRWMSVGLVASARGNWSDGLFYLMVLTGHAALAYLTAAVVARDLYRQGFDRLQGGAPPAADSAGTVSTRCSTAFSSSCHAPSAC